MTSCFSFVFAKALSPTEAEALRRTLSSAEPSKAPSPTAAACGRSMLVSAVLANAPVPTTVTFVRSAAFSAVFAKALSPISVTPAPSVSAVTPLPSNICAGTAPLSMVTSLRFGILANTPAGMSAGSHLTTSFLSPVRPSSAPSPMVVSESGRVSSSSCAQPANARAPMSVTESNRSTSRMELFMKASAPIVVNTSLCATEKYSMVWLSLNTPSPNPTTGSFETVRWG